jgi:hypothetical protein
MRPLSWLRTPRASSWMAELGVREHQGRQGQQRCKSVSAGKKRRLLLQLLQHGALPPPLLLLLLPPCYTPPLLLLLLLPHTPLLLLHTLQTHLWTQGMSSFSLMMPPSLASSTASV